MSSRTRIEMELWRAGLAAELAQQSWTLAEIGMIADICNGVIVPDVLVDKFLRVPVESLS